jgi:hypothetical protein
MANETNNLQIVIEAINKASTQLKQVEKDLSKLSVTAKDTGGEAKIALNPLQKMADKLLGMGDSAKLATSSVEGFARAAISMAPKMLIVSLAIGSVIAVITGLISIIKKSVNAYNEYEQTITGLMSVSAAFGQSQSKAIEEAKRLASDGLISVSTAASGLKTIMQTGLGLPKAIELMEVYKNRAATGRGASISYDQAVRNLSETFMTENSTLGNLSGQAENYNLIMEIGAGILGKKAASLNNAERAEAKYLGTVELGKKAIGDSNRYSNTYLGTLSRLKNTFTMMSIEIGSYFQPILKNLAEWLERNLNIAGSGVSIFKGLAYAVQILSTAVQIATDSFMGLFRIIVGGIKSISTLSFAPLVDSLMQTGEALTKDWEGFFSAWEDISNIGIAEINKNMVEMFDQTSEEAKKKAQELAKLQEDYAHSLLLTNKDFKRNLEDLVISHRDAYKALKKDISSEKIDFKKAMEDKKQDFDKAMASIKETHNDKTKSILDDIEAEKKAYKKEVEEINEEWGTIISLTQSAGKDRLNNLQAQLDKELSLGEHADQNKITSLRTMIENMNRALEEALKAQEGVRDKEIADVTETTDDKITLLQEGLEKENLAYEVALLERKEQYDEDVSNAKEAYEEKLKELEIKLSEEEMIREKYAEDFKKIGDKKALDDITTLKNSHKEQLEEMEYQYQKSLERLEGFESSKTNIIKNAEEEQRNAIAETNKELEKSISLIPEWMGSVSSSGNKKNISPSWLTEAGFGYQHGGVVSQPSIVGEKNYPEVVLPLNEPQRISDILNGLGISGKGGQSVIQNFTITVSREADVEMIMERAAFRAKYLK